MQKAGAAVPESAEAEGWDTYIDKGVYLTLCSLALRISQIQLCQKQSNNERSRECYIQSPLYKLPAWASALLLVLDRVGNARAS